MDNTPVGQLLRNAQQDEAEEKRRRLTLYFISYVGATIMAFMAWLNWGTDNPLLVGALATSASVIYLNVALSHIFPKSDVFYYVAGVIVLFTINALVYTGGLNSTGLYFIFPLIFIQIIVVRFKPAMVYVAVTMVLAIYMLYNQDVIVAKYPDEHVSRFLIAIFCFICVTFIGENFWHKSRKEMLRENLERMRQANTDPLTKLPNRRFLEAVFFERAIENPDAYFPLTVVVVDIDHFKKINDTYGHDIGDEVLIHFTSILKKVVRASDVIARTGGEEFLVLFPLAPLSQGVKLAEKMRKAVEESPFIEGDINHSITASFGVATALTDDKLHASLKLADDNLYKAKNGGRNRVAE